MTPNASLELPEHIAWLEHIARDMKDLSADTHLLAINSAIEAAHATLVIKRLSETILDDLMQSQAWLVAELLKVEAHRSSDFLKELAARAGISEIHVTDGDGVVCMTTYDPLIGWRFPEDPKEQASVFRPLLAGGHQAVCQSLQPRSLDRAIFKYVGVARQDAPGIVQVGLRGEEYHHYQGQTGKVFGVISQEIRRLSDAVGEKAKEIAAFVQALKEGSAATTTSLGE